MNGQQTVGKPFGNLKPKEQVVTAVKPKPTAEQVAQVNKEVPQIKSVTLQIKTADLEKTAKEIQEALKSKQNALKRDPENSKIQQSIKDMQRELTLTKEKIKNLDKPIDNQRNTLFSDIDNGFDTVGNPYGNTKTQI